MAQIYAPLEGDRRGVFGYFLAACWWQLVVSQESPKTSCLVFVFRSAGIPSKKLKLKVTARSQIQLWGKQGFPYLSLGSKLYCYRPQIQRHHIKCFLLHCWLLPRTNKSAGLFFLELEQADNYLFLLVLRGWKDNIESSQVEWVASHRVLFPWSQEVYTTCHAVGFSWYKRFGVPMKFPLSAGAGSVATSNFIPMV